MPITTTSSPTTSLQPSKRAIPSKSRKSHGEIPLGPSNSGNIMPPPPPPLDPDQADKANRRKSAHFGDIGVAPGDGTSRVGTTGTAGKRTVSALTMAGKEGRKLGKRLSAVNPEMVGVSWEQRESKYEEWMKAAIDNKITSSNTWNFALIDYFHDMTLLRNGPDDQSINFQKASSTLDGCVKIWTSRVDSVATETGKLLSGLAGGNGEDPEDEEEGGEDGDRPKTTRKTQSSRPDSTLAKSFSALQVKKLDLAFEVDPLFKKTSEDFDEGGAMGLLMNHLGVDGRGRVVFDAGDAVVEEDEEDLGDGGWGVEVDLTKLRQYIPSPATTQNLTISSTLSTFKFSSDPSAMPDLTSLFGLKDTWGEEDDGHMDDFSDFGSPSRGGDGGGGGPVDFFGDDDYSGTGGGGGFDDGASISGDIYTSGDLRASASGGSGALGLAQPGENLAPFDPRRQGGEMVMALTGAGDEGEGMFDYFDKGFGKRGWAGAEHWKLRKVAKKDLTITTKRADKDKSTKTPFTINFSDPLPSSLTSKTLFAPASKSSITLPDPLASTSTSSSKSKKKRGSSKDTSTTKGEKARLREKEGQANLLPDDMHFSSRQLVRLFMKPKFALRMRRNTKVARMENADGEIDENYWAQAASERAEDGDVNMGESSMPPPFESQFFADGDDATDAGDFAFVDDALDPDQDHDGTTPAPMLGDEGEDDLWQGTQGQIKRARPENVNFAKRAKRVDVKRLKDDIWSNLKSIVNEPTTSDPPLIPVESQMVEPTTKTFDNIITDLRRTYPRQKMSEISTSFCFICLLHLANEEGLTLESARFDGLEGEDVGCQGVAEMDLPSLGIEGAGISRRGKEKIGVTEGERVVGELQALRVYKDPNAGRAA